MAEHLAEKGGSAFPFFRENMQRGGVGHLIQPMEMPSVEAARRFPDESLDFVMIDGAHDYKSVRADVRAWFPKVKRGGLLAGDDADWPEVLISVHETIPQSELTISNGGANWSYRKQRPVRGQWTVRRSNKNGSDVFAYIPYVNRPDLLHLRCHVDQRTLALAGGDRSVSRRFEARRALFAGRNCGRVPRGAQ